MNILERIRLLNESDDKFAEEYAEISEKFLNSPGMKTSAEGVFKTIAIYCNLHPGFAKSISPELSDSIDEEIDNQKADMKDKGKKAGDLEPERALDIAKTLSSDKMKGDGKKQSGENSEVKSISGMETTGMELNLGNKEKKDSKEGGKPERDSKTLNKYIHIYSLMSESTDNSTNILKAMEVKLETA